MSTITADVADAVGELEEHFGPRVKHESDDGGGVVVTIGEVELAAGWGRSSAPLQFIIPYNFPATPPYPYYLPRDAQPAAAWPPALQPIEWRGEPMIQVSLRHNNWDPARDGVIGCVMQVAAWLRAQ